MSRINAREIVYQLLFPINFNIKEDNKISFNEAFENFYKPVEIDEEITNEMLIKNEGDILLTDKDTVFTDKEATLSNEDKEFIEKEYNGIIKNKETLLEIIKNNLTNYSIEKIYKPDLIALLIAVYEITFEDEISPKTSVNEAVNICKKYSTENSYKFVNGVLAEILKDKNNG